MLSLATRMILFIAWMHQTLMADEQIAPRKGLLTYLANEWLLFGMCSYMSLQVFLNCLTDQPTSHRKRSSMSCLD